MPQISTGKLPEWSIFKEDNQAEKPITFDMVPYVLQIITLIFESTIMARYIHIPIERYVKYRDVVFKELAISF